MALERHESPESPGEGLRPLGDLDMEGLAQRLDALDEELGRRDAASGLDLTEARRAFEALEAVAGAGAGFVRERAAALAALEREVGIRLDAAGDRVRLAQGLQRLEEAVFLPPRLLAPASGPESVVHACARSDEALARARTQAAEFIASRTGLMPMPDQTGARIDPVRHAVVASETGPEGARNNTVAAQESTGWLLNGEVLVQARVVRYASDGSPDLPAAGGFADLDGSIFGRKRGS